MATQSRIDRALAMTEQLHQVIVPIVTDLANQLEPLNTDLARKADALRVFLEQL
jgi:hypothetical protein